MDKSLRPFSTKLITSFFLDEKTFIEKRSFLIRNISNFFSFNLNQNTLLNNLEENYFDD